MAPQLVRGLTWSSITRFGGRRCFCTLELATSTIEAKGVFLRSPGRGLTCSSIGRFCGGRCLSTLELAISTIEAKGVFLCKVSPGVLLLDLAAEGAFVLWNLQLLLAKRV